VVIRRSDDFTGVVRWPELEREINRPLPPGNPVREAMRAGQQFGTLTFPASSDGVVRTYSYRSVTGYPFFVLVALARDDALAGWQARSAAVGGSGLLLVLLLAGLLAHLWRIEHSEVRALTALQSSEERLRLALAASQQGLYDLDVQSGEALVNDEYALMLGHDPAQFHESNAAWIERLHPDDRDRVARVYADYIAGRVPEYRVEFRQRTRDGQYKWILSVGKVVERDAHGAPLRMLGVHRDIGERKQAEHALKTLNIELESRVAQRTAELESTRDEAERANRAKSEFLSSMSHELRTPMHAILGFGQLLESDTDRLPDPARRYVREILRAGEHLLELIDDLLDLARIEAGKHETHLEPVPVSVLIDESLGLVEPAAHARGITLSFAAPISPDCIVTADRMRLKQVLLNLLSNAIKYNREGGSVQLGCTAEGETLRISVTDSGPGLSPEQQAQLFTPFERLGASKSAIKGAGIGLVLTKQLIAMMHGEVGLRSEPGVGSTFWVQLPRAAAAASPAGRVDAPAQVASSRSSREDRQTVLYIEDDPVNVMLMEALFATQPGLRLVTAQTAAQGLEIARDQRPEVILLDIQLPDADGYEVLRRLRAAEPTREIPVLAVSANAMPSDIERGLASGFADYLTKPLDFARLLAAVQRALQAPSLR
jgi:PAS domain S-box-containing protein